MLPYFCLHCHIIFKKTHIFDTGTLIINTVLINISRCTVNLKRHIALGNPNNTLILIILLLTHAGADTEFFPGDGGGGFRGIFPINLLCKFQKIKFGN